VEVDHPGLGRDTLNVLGHGKEDTMQHLDTSLRLYKVECEEGHSQKLTATEMELLIRSGEYACPECQKSLALALPLDLECHICSDVFNVSDLEEAKGTMETRCMACNERGFNENSIYVRNSWGYFAAVHGWKYNGPDEERLKHGGRTDYWEAVIHFCEPHEFVSIYRERKIRAGRTGYFNKPAVCLTEAPVGNWKELQERHGSFGYVFLKRDLIVEGGGPAVYLSENLIRAQKNDGGFCDEIKPFLNLIRIPSVTPERSPHDFLHEREWRLPIDLLFEKVRPYAVVIGDYDTGTDGWEDIWRTRIEFEELS
jgi:hypothetical protein